MVETKAITVNCEKHVEYLRGVIKSSESIIDRHKLNIEKATKELNLVIKLREEKYKDIVKW